MRALVLALLIAACRPAPQAASFTLRVAVSGPLDKLDPRVEGQSWSVIAKRLVYERLIGIGPTGEIIPGLASKIEAAGPAALRVWLRPDARFSDGSPVTFADVAGSLRGSQLLATSEGESIVFRTEDASVPTELLLSRAFVFRQSGDRALGTGAFAVREEDATHLVLSRSHPVPGFIEHVRLDSYPTPQDAFARTLKGDADMLAEVQPRWIEFFEGVPRMRILRAEGNHANMVAFNPRRLSREERLALARQLSADEVRLLAFGGECAPSPRRPEGGTLPSGRALEVLTVPFFDRFAAAVRRALGVRGGEIRDAETQELFSAVRSGNFDLATIRPAVWPPFMATLIWRTGATSNIFGYSNAAVDAALDARDWKAAQRALDADPPAAYVCASPIVLVLDSRIKTPPLEAGFFFESLPRWEVLQ